MSGKLDNGKLNILRLIVKGRGDGEWATYNHITQSLVEMLPPELVEIEPLGDDNRGRIRLTTKGQQVWDAMEYYR